MVIFGANGDLTRRKLIPALYSLSRDGLLPEQFAVLGVERREPDVETFRKRLDDGSRKYIGAEPDEVHWQRTLQYVHHLSGDLADPDLYSRLAERLAELTGPGGLVPNFLFYLATPPRFFADIATGLGRVGLLDESGGHWRRVVVEKPFGNDLQSARDLNRQLHAQEQAWLGNRGGLFWAVRASDGTPQAKYELKSIPVFDGLSAAGGRLFMAMRDGSVECWGGAKP